MENKKQKTDANLTKVFLVLIETVRHCLASGMVRRSEMLNLVLLVPALNVITWLRSQRPMRVVLVIVDLVVLLVGVRLGHGALVAFKRHRFVAGAVGGRRRAVVVIVVVVVPVQVVSHPFNALASLRLFRRHQTALLVDKILLVALMVSVIESSRGRRSFSADDLLGRAFAIGNSPVSVGARARSLLHDFGATRADNEPFLRLVMRERRHVMVRLARPHRLLVVLETHRSGRLALLLVTHVACHRLSFLHFVRFVIGRCHSVTSYIFENVLKLMKIQFMCKLEFYAFKKSLINRIAILVFKNRFMYRKSFSCDVVTKF